MKAAFGLLFVCFISATFAFQLNPINDPFTGTFSPNPYEYFTTGLPFLLSNPALLWGDHATIAGTDPNAFAYALVNNGPYNNVCQLSPRFGTTVLVTLGKVSIAWDQDLYAFGGYFGANHNANGPLGNDIILDFFDASNTHLATTTITIPNNCSWIWKSWGFSSKVVRRVEITGPESNGLVVTDQLRVSTTDVYVPGGTSGTTGTTGTTFYPGGIPVCPGRDNDISVQNKGSQERVDNEIDNEYIEGRFELKSSDIFQAWFTRLSFPYPDLSAKTRFKSRIRSIIEFIDNNDDGYVPGSDTIVKETNLIDLNMVFMNWQSTGDFFTGLLPSASNPIFVFRGKVERDTSPCAGFPLVPNVASIKLDVDWTSRYTQPNTKIALKVRFTMFQDVKNTTTGVETATIFSGDQRQVVFNEFIPNGQPAFVDSELGAVGVINYVVDTGSPDQPEYEVYYTMDTIDHGLHFNGFTVVQPKPPV